MRTSRALLLAGALTIGASLVTAAATVAQDAKGGKAAPAGAAAHGKGGGLQSMGGELVAELKKSPGCLGVEAGGLQSGKLAIFAWFKDKESLLTWYHSDYHMGAMGSMQAGFAAQKKAAGALPPDDGKSDAAKDAEHAPLEFIADDVGTLLCIATITPSTQPQVPGIEASLGQISIELYKPLPGGASFGGTFAPLAVPLEHHRGSRVPLSAPPAAPATPEKADGKSGAKSGG